MAAKVQWQTEHTVREGTSSPSKYWVPLLMQSGDAMGIGGGGAEKKKNQSIHVKLQD